MSRRPLNRMADPLTREDSAQHADPASTDSGRLPSSEVTPVVLTTVVPALICIMCGRGMQPLVLRARPNGDRDCQCSSCGGEFVYTPPRMRPKA